MTTTYTDEQAEAIAEHFDALIDSQTEYAESHSDAGNNYAHMPRESWIHNDELQKFIDANDIDCKGLDIDELAELYLDNFTMVSVHMFATSKPDIFQPFAYAVGEVEIQVELNTIAQELDITLVQLINCLVDTHVLRKKHSGNVAEVYGNSDMSWCASMSASELQEHINDAIA